MKKYFGYATNTDLYRPSMNSQIVHIPVRFQILVRSFSEVGQIVLRIWSKRSQNIAWVRFDLRWERFDQKVRTFWPKFKNDCFLHQCYKMWKDNPSFWGSGWLFLPLPGKDSNSNRNAGILSDISRIKDWS